MWPFIGLLSLLSIFITAIVLIVALIKKMPKKQIIIVLLTSFVLFFAAIGMTPDEALQSDTDSDESSNIDSTEAVNADSTEAVNETTAPPDTYIKEIKYEFTGTQERVYESVLREIRWESLIEITNTGDFPIYLGLSKFDLNDENGKLLKTGNFSSFPSIIHPGEKGYFYGDVEVSGTTLNSKVICEPRWDLEKSKNERINFDVSEIDIRSEKFGTTVFGKIANNTGGEQTWAIISAVLYARDGSPIGVWMTNVMENIPVGSNFGFEISGIGSRTLYEKITPDMVGSYTVYAYSPQYQ